MMDIIMQDQENTKEQHVYEPPFRRGYELELKGAYVLVKKTCLEKHGYVFGSIFKDGKKIFDIQVDNGRPSSGGNKKGYRWKILELVSTSSLFGDLLGQPWTREELCMTAKDVIIAYSSISELIQDNSVSALEALQKKLAEYKLDLGFAQADDLLMPGFQISVGMIGLHITVDFNPYSTFNNFMNNLVGTAEKGIPIDCQTVFKLNKTKHQNSIKYHQLVWNYVNSLLNTYANGWGEDNLNLARAILFTLLSDQVNPVYLKKLKNRVNNGKDVYGIIVKNNLKRLCQLMHPNMQKELFNIISLLSNELSIEEQGDIQKLIFVIVNNLPRKVNLYDNIEDCLTQRGKQKFPKIGDIPQQILWIEQQISDPNTKNITADVFGAYGVQFFDQTGDGGRDYDIFNTFNEVVSNEKWKGIGLAESLDSLLVGKGISIPIIAELRFCKGIHCGELSDLNVRLNTHLNNIEAYIEKWMK